MTTTENRPTTTRGGRWASPDQRLEQQLAALRFRLMIELARGTTPSRKVYESFERALAGFGDARVRTFVPILVERAVRAEFPNSTERR